MPMHFALSVVEKPEFDGLFPPTGGTLAKTRFQRDILF